MVDINPKYWVHAHMAFFMEDHPLDSVDRLTEIVGAPAASPPGQDWEAVEERLGATLPADYKRLVDRFGAGQFGSIRVCAPDASVPEYDLFALVDRIQAQAEEFRPTTEPPFNAPFHPQEGGLVPWGEMDGGFTFFWKPTSDTDARPVVVSDPSWLAWYQPCRSASTFIADYLNSPTGELDGIELEAPAAGVGVRFVPAISR
ncbi:SMI1/KNR4 family protein [Lentzea rhizosphaerae]|uniref:SMI1/KNR4 family protein n=1 Tax=Lentzea rhizosphaerae TaxID=2041025 RepID=A0ABV8C8N9_9PSEU